MNTLWAKIIRVFFAILGNLTLTPVILNTRLRAGLSMNVRRLSAALLALLIIARLVGFVYQSDTVIAATSTNLNFQV